AHAGPAASGIDAPAGVVVLAAPGSVPVRSARRINAVLTAVRGMIVHAVAEGTAPGHLVPILYEVADDRDLPGAAQGGHGRMSWRISCPAPAARARGAGGPGRRRRHRRRTSGRAGRPGTG